MNLFKGQYRTGGIYLALYTAEEGEPYSDVTVNIPPFTTDNVIALNGDFNNYVDEDLKDAVLNKLHAEFLANVPSGYTTFPLYGIDMKVVENIPELAW